MLSLMRKPYILYKRAAGDRRVWHVAFWDEERRDYSIRRSADALIRSLGPRASGMLPTQKAGADAAARLALEIGVPSRSGRTFLQFIESFWAEGSPYLTGAAAYGKPHSAAYLTEMRSVLRLHVRPYLERVGKVDVPLSRVTAGFLRDLFLALYQAGLSPGRTNQARKAIAVALKDAKDMGQASTNPAAQVKRLHEATTRRELLSLEQVKALFELPWADPRYLAANMLAAYAGLRIGEVRGLQAEDILPGELHIRHNWQDAERAGAKMKGPKHSTLIEVKDRRMPIGPRLEALLRQLAAANPWGDGFVIYGYHRGKPPSRILIERSFNEAVAAIGIPEAERRRRKLTFHSWRAWYDTMLAPMLPAMVRRKLVGHSGAAMDEVYLQIAPEHRKLVAEMQEKLMGGGSESGG
jgi:integrase